jgi:hypothetical protein
MAKKNSDDEDLTPYDTLSSAAPDPRPGPDTVITATKETLDNDREDLGEDILHLSD